MSALPPVPPPPVVDSVPPPPPAPFAADPVPPAVASRRWLVAAIAVAAVLVVAVTGMGGFALGASSVDVTQSEEFVKVDGEKTQLADKLATVTDERDGLAEERDGLRDDLAAANLLVDGIDLREAEVAAVQTALDERENAVAAREVAIGSAEDAEAARTISGDGTYRVGVSIEPGTYSSPGSDLCYWARLSGLSGELNDIITNSIRSEERRVGKECPV